PQSPAAYRNTPERGDRDRGRHPGRSRLRPGACAGGRGEGTHRPFRLYQHGAGPGGPSERRLHRSPERRRGRGGRREPVAVQGPGRSDDPRCIGRRGAETPAHLPQRNPGDRPALRGHHRYPGVELMATNQSRIDLYELLPATYRIDDAEQGYPLRALMELINRQANLLKEDISGLYDDLF